MSQKHYLAILRFGIYLSPFVVFLVFKDLLFPYITSKQITFNILVEILTVFWVAFIVKFPEWRPKKSLITVGLGAFFAVVLLTCFTGVNFTMSFWGNVERMLGWFHIAHFLMYYLIIITVMRSWKDWRILFIISILCSSIISIHSLSGKIDSTIGNTAYVSAYLIFNFYFILLLISKEKMAVIKFLYASILLVLIPAFWGLNTSGAYVGLGISILLFLFFYGLLQKNKNIKIASISIFIFLALGTVLVFAEKNSSFVKDNTLLSKITHLVSSDKGTFQTRLLSWKSAYKDFPNHPLLGTGFGNYAIIFDKFFDPKFYNITPGETYFDRAHNNLIEIISTTGVIGVLAYLSIFVAAFYYLFIVWKKEKISLGHYLLINALIVAYFIQNLAIFDAFVTYLLLMVTLGYIYFLNNDHAEEVAERKSLVNKEIYGLFFAGIVMAFLLYQNFLFLKMLDGTIAGQISLAQGDIIGAYNNYKQALSYNTGLDRDSRDTYIRSIVSAANGATGIRKMDAKDQKMIFDFTEEAVAKNLAYNPVDSLELFQSAQLFDVISTYQKDQAKFSEYSNKTEQAIDAAIKSSPGRVQLFFFKAQVYLNRGQVDKAIETMKYAISLNTDYADGYCDLGNIYFYLKRETEAYQMMDSCFDPTKHGLGVIKNPDILKIVVNNYLKKNDFNRALVVMQALSVVDTSNPEVFVNLAKLYFRQNRLAEAKQAALKAAELDKSLTGAVDAFVKQIDASSNNQAPISK